MSKICVEVEIDTETGDITVAECPPGEDMPGEESGEPAGQSFQDIKSALAAVEQMLTAPREDQGPSELEAAMSDGYSKVAGKRPMASSAGGQYMADEM
jgi:hypothetical protein